jgi:predicted DNA-binding protein
MEVHLSAELEKQLNDVAAKTGRDAGELAQDVIAGYLEELASVRGSLDSRYDDLKSGRVKPIDGEAFFENLRRREEALPKRSPR